MRIDIFIQVEQINELEYHSHPIISFQIIFRIENYYNHFQVGTTIIIFITIKD
jgi:hypothetical protein